MPATKIVDNGSDAERLVFVVVGDGYAEADQTKFQNDVTRLIVNGVLGHDVFTANRQAFNVYRVDLISKDSGVSITEETKDTALKLVYTGTWSTCWIQESEESDSLARAAVKDVAWDFIVLLVNHDGFGGCARGRWLYITAGVGWDLVAHEYGHGIAGLYEEYEGTAEYPGPPINELNCSSILDRERVVWRDLIAEATELPTTLEEGMSADTIGMFEGANAYATKIYRPADNCLMQESGQDPVPPFCPICRRLMSSELARYLPHPGQEFEADPEGARNDVANMRSDESDGTADARRPSYVFVELRVYTGGRFEVLSAREMSGTPVMRNSPHSRFAYEITSGQEIVSIETLAEDPFVVRGFPDPAEPKQRPHRREYMEAAVIPVKIPMPAAVLERNAVGMRLYTSGEDAREGTTEALTFEEMKATTRLRLKLEISAEELGPAILTGLRR